MADHLIKEAKQNVIKLKNVQIDDDLAPNDEYLTPEDVYEIFKNEMENYGFKWDTPTLKFIQAPVHIFQ